MLLHCFVRHYLLELRLKVRSIRDTNLKGRSTGVKKLRVGVAVPLHLLERATITSSKVGGSISEPFLEWYVNRIHVVPAIVPSVFSRRSSVSLLCSFCV